MALRSSAGKRIIDKLYADRSGEISKSLKTLGIMPQGSHPRVPKTNVVAGTANGDVLARTGSLLRAASLPYYFWEYASRCNFLVANVHWY